MFWPSFSLFVTYLAAFLWPLFERCTDISDAPSYKVPVWCLLWQISDRSCADAPTRLPMFALHQAQALLSWSE